MPLKRRQEFRKKSVIFEGLFLSQTCGRIEEVGHVEEGEVDDVYKRFTEQVGDQEEVG